MFRFLHAADIHLDSPLRGLARYDGAPVEAIRGAARRALENLVELAIEQRVAFVLIAGDLYDGGWKDHNTGLFFAAQMARLKRAGVEVFVISGNHDAASKITRHLRMPDNVVRLSHRKPETVVREALGVAIHGQGYASRAITRDLSAAYPDATPGLFNIGLLHTSVNGREGHESYAPCTVAGLRSKGYDYWALGHVHRREVLSEDPWIVFCGNIQGRHARETGAKGCTLVTVADGAVTEVAHRPLDVLRWVRCVVDVEGTRSADEALERVAETLRGVVAEQDGRAVAARVVVQGTCPAHAELAGDPEHWLGQIRALAVELDEVWIEKVRLRTRGVTSIEDLAARDDALGGLLQAIDGARVDDDELDELIGLFSDLRQKLPAELRVGDAGFDPCASPTVRVAIDDARELLLARVLAHGARGGQR